MKILVLADTPPDAIAQRLGQAVDVIQTAEALYFDVRPQLQANDWILTQVILREADRGNDQLAADLRVAYYGGSAAIHALLDARAGLPTDPVQRLGDMGLLLHAKMQQALDIRLTPATAENFQQLYAQIRRDEQQLQLDREKLAFRQRRWEEHRQLAEAKLQLQAQQAAAASAASKAPAEPSIQQPALYVLPQDAA